MTTFGRVGCEHCIPEFDGGLGVCQGTKGWCPTAHLAPSHERAADMVNHPPHYNSHPSGVQCIDITRHLTFDVGNAVKYVFRAEFKNGREDYDKAHWYLTDAIRHADPVFLASWNFRVSQALDRVRHAETDPHRREFFWAIHVGDLTIADELVLKLLNTA